MRNTLTRKVEHVTGTGVVVTGAFDDMRLADFRFLQEAAVYGQVTACVWDDASVESVTGQSPRFPLAERLYFLNAVRYVSRALAGKAPEGPDFVRSMKELAPEVWADRENTANRKRETFCHQNGIEYLVLHPSQTEGVPEIPPASSIAGRKKVVVTGCYDWLHSGHVRFFEEVSAYGDLYVIVGHDANIRLLKGEGHPLLPQEVRRYLTGSIRFVTQSLVSTGAGWLDAEPEIRRLKPDIYAVNEDGDRGGKREYCARQGIEYLVLKRIPAPGLPKRSSTELRGF